MAADQKVHSGSSKPTILHQHNSLRVPTSSFSLPFPGAKSISDSENDGVNEEIDLRPTKKRRLTANQVQFLEKNFEEGNKLEPERKLKLAGELGLHPRQVAIWFQNKRARFKNKQLEKGYDSLSADCEKLKLDYDNLLKEKESLENEVVSLKQKLHSKERAMETLEPMDSQQSYHKSTPKAIYGKISCMPKVITPKEGHASSAKSEGFDSGSHVSLLEPADSSQAFELNQSELSQDKINDASRRSFLSSLYFPSSCNLELPLEDQPFWAWTY